MLPPLALSARALVLSTLLASVSAQEPERVPLPETAAVDTARGRIDAAFEERLTSPDPDIREELAVELFSMAAGSSTPAQRYALLQRSAAVAASAGRLALLEDVLAELDGAFRDLPLARSIEHLEAARRGLRRDEDRTPLVVAWLRLVDRARLADDWKVALRASERALALARGMKDKQLIARCQEKRRAVRALRIIVSKRDAPPRLFAEDPADPAIRGAYGEYLCLARGRWREGIAFVLEGPAGARLTPVAQREKALADAAPGDRSATDHRQLADELYARARKERRRLAAAALFARARHHYRAAHSGLPALEAAEVDARLRDIPPWVEDWGRTPRFAAAPFKLHAIGDRAELTPDGPYLHLRLEKENNMWAGLRGTAPFYVRPLTGQRDELIVAYRLATTGLPDKSQFAVTVWNGDGHAMYCGPQKDTDNAPTGSVRCLGSTPETPTFAGPTRIAHGRKGQLRVIREADTLRFSWRAQARDGWTDIQSVKTTADLRYIGIMAKKWGAEPLDVSFRVL